MAAALAYGFAVASILFVAMFTWATIGSFLFPVDLTRDQEVGVDTPSIKADSNCISGRRRVPCRGKTHCRYGRRRGSKGYLEKQLKKTNRQGREQQRMYEEGLASIRGGVDPAQVAPTRKSARGHKPNDLDKGNAVAGRQHYSHLEWLKMERERKLEPDWDPNEHEKWLDKTEPRRKEAKRIFDREQREQNEIEQEEADEREEQANASAIDEECQRCHETEDRSDTDVIILCDGDGCSGAAHLGCCDPPLEHVPDGKWFCDQCAELHRGEEGGDDDALPDAGSGAGCVGDDTFQSAGNGDSGPPGGGGDEDLSDADFGTDEVEKSDDETLPDAAPDGQAQRIEKPRRKRNATRSQCELCALKPSKYDSLIWSPVKEGASKILTTLNENYKKAMAMLKEIRIARTKSDYRTLTYHQIQSTLENEDNFRAVVNKLEKFDYRLYGIKVQGGGFDGTQVRRHQAFYESACQESPTWEHDKVVLNKIFDAYAPVATAKRDEAAVHENNLARIGRGNKVNKGRTMHEWNTELKTLGKLAKECGIDPILAKIGDANRRKGVIAMCLEVLEDGGRASMGTRPDESHMYPEMHRDEIDKVVDVLANAGVSAEDLERFSCALHIIDSLTSACLRPQDSLGCMARKAYIRNGRLVFVLPSVAKNSKSLLRSAAGMVVHHIKADEIAEDQSVKDHFAMARHGEYEMRRSYDLVKSENAPYDPESFSARTRPSEAEALLKRALEIYKANLGPEHVNVANTLHAMGVCERDSGRTSEADALLKRALDIKEAKLGTDHVNVANTLHAMGMCERDSGRTSEAEALLKRALDIKEAKLGTDHVEVAYTLHELALSAREAGRPGEAEAFSKRAREIGEANLS
eukprot:g17350.t2